MILSHSQIAIRMAAEHAGVTVEQIAGHARNRPISFARFAAMAALTRVGWSSTQIGRVLGDRDHTSVLYGLKRMSDMPSSICLLAHDIEAALRASMEAMTDETAPADPADTLVAA